MSSLTPLLYCPFLGQNYDWEVSLKKRGFYWFVVTGFEKIICGRGTEKFKNLHYVEAYRNHLIITLCQAGGIGPSILPE